MENHQRDLLEDICIRFKNNLYSSSFFSFKKNKVFQRQKTAEFFIKQYYPKNTHNFRNGNQLPKHKKQLTFQPHKYTQQKIHSIIQLKEISFYPEMFISHASISNSKNIK